jgi:endonuclease VIII
MPEGPSIVIIKEALQEFKGKRILHATGNAKINMSLLENKKITDIKSWGKHLLICCEDGTIRIHLMMFGSYRINERKEIKPRLSLEFKDGEMNFYNTATKLIEGNLDDVYDWSADVLSDKWNASKAKKKLKTIPQTSVCDALLDQQIFSGVGNIIKNEVLFRIYVHPKSIIGTLPAKQLNELIKEARNYSFDFLKWKREYTLRKHWLIYTKKMCPRCNIPVKKEYLGETKRRTFFCDNCQVKYL